MKIYLGSSSPRRKSLLNLLINDFYILPPEINEDPLIDELASDFCLRISREKAESLLPKINDRQFLLITSDTVVSYENHILGKPTDYNDAQKTLKLLSGNKHQVLTSISIHGKLNNYFSMTEIEKTDILFKNLTDEIIKTYLNNVHFLDKAGSYAIQEQGELIIQNSVGSISNVVGFPMRLFLKMLNSLDILKDIL